MRRAKVAAGLSAVAASLALASANSAQPPAVSLLREAVAAPSTTSYTGIVEVVRIGNQTSEVSVYRIEHRAPDLTKRTYTAPSDLAGDTVISDRDLSYSIDVKRHRIIKETNVAVEDGTARADNYALLRTNYDVGGHPDELFVGRQTADVLLTNKYTHHPTMLLRIDRESKLILDKQEYSADGSMVGETRFEEISFTGDVPASDFAIPKSYYVVQGPRLGQPSEDPGRILREAGFAAQEPHQLPEGFQSVEGGLIELKGVRTVHVLYSDGIRTVSLFENARGSAPDMSTMHPQRIRIAGRDAECGTDGATTLLAWTDGDLHYMLVGELALPELQQIAASIAP